MTTLTPTPPQGKLLLSQREAAAMLSISTRTLFSIIKSGKLPAVRIGSGGVRVALSDLERFIDQQRIS
ncbi:MAG: helix-turn-helix domain-containing protein [Proteobacteria bacterium]|nr:helix-turn-helix domain-containing protein [Pseudomonadota bacterium]